MNQPPSYTTPTKVKLLILAAAFGGLTLQFVQFVFFWSVVNDFPSPFEMFDEIEVTYDNRTSVTAYVYLERRLETTVPPNQSVTISDRKFLWWFGQRVEVRDASGRILFATKLDMDDLKERQYRIVIDGP